MSKANKETLLQLIRQLDGKGYREYKRLAGDYDFGQFRLIIDHVQGDPFASPSTCRIQISHQIAQIPSIYYNTKVRKVALADFLTRAFSEAINSIQKTFKGTGNSSRITIDTPGQEILDKSSVVITTDFIEVRFTVGLPAEGRRIKASEAYDLFSKRIHSLPSNSLVYNTLNQKKLQLFINTAEDADFLRNQLDKESLVAFVANGSILPRASGIDQRPLKSGHVIPFMAPDSLTVTFNRPNAGPISGLGIRKGITLITGGGFHGKSTLLNAIELGIYNHIPGDGREFIVSSPTSFKVRSEDGRPVIGTNISYFINHLPYQKETTSFCTLNASGSTSQAANIIEAFEAGTNCLLIDEDTSATNFMIRDNRMQKLISKANEPITPFLDRIKDLYEQNNISTILVMGGSGDYLEVADLVIMMSSYKVEDKTADAKRIVAAYPNNRQAEQDTPFDKLQPRYPSIAEHDLNKGNRKASIKSSGLHRIKLGYSEIDLSHIEQLVHSSQTHTITQLLKHIVPSLKGNISFTEVLQLLEDRMAIEGLHQIGNTKDGFLAQVRKLDIAAALNRIRILKMR